ncbi:MAG: serine protease [Actinobacteria bacterium]|nr:serine protease [Actinomycetota bacterium]
MAPVLAVIVALLATFVYASVDAGRPIVGGPTTVPAARAETPAAPQDDERPTTTKGPENLSSEDLTKKVAASVRTVRTLDEAGQPVEGSAFAVGSFGGQSLFLASLAVVRASTRSPAPAIALEGGRDATLWTWDEESDLALLVIPGSVETLPFVSSGSSVKPGERIYASAGSNLFAGVILSSSSTAIEHNIPVGLNLQGAPIVNQKGEVLALASRAYNPGGNGTETVFSGVPISVACERVLQCGTGNTGPGSTPTSTP